MSAAGETIETERLRLERWDVDRHTAGLAALNADPEVMRFIGEGRALTRAESERQSETIAAHWGRFGFGLWAVVPTAAAVGTPSPGTVGFAGLAHPLWLPGEETRVEVGWRLARAAWGRGFATEAARAAVAAGFGELGLDELVSYIRPGNARSQAVARRLGMAVTRRVADPRPQHSLEVWTLGAGPPRRGHDALGPP